jgi:phage tail-like protein
MSRSRDAVATPPIGVPAVQAGAVTGVITVSVDGNVVQVVSLTGKVLTIGRLPDNGLVLSHATISRRHAEIRLDGAYAILTDLGSSSGTRVGDHRLKPNEPVALESGDTAQIGPYTLTYAVIATAPPAGAPVFQPLEPAQAPLPAPVDEPPLPVLARRTTYPVPRPPLGPSRYVRDLPGMYQESGFLSRMLLIFEAIWEPLEQRQDHFQMYFAARTCPGDFIPWLASWLHLTIDSHWSEPRQRALLAEAMDLYRWRGTKYGLVRMIEVCTGLTPMITEKRDKPYVFEIAVAIPPDSAVRRELIEDLIATHKPAHVGYVLHIR